MDVGTTIESTKLRGNVVIPEATVVLVHAVPYVKVI